MNVVHVVGLGSVALSGITESDLPVLEDDRLDAQLFRHLDAPVEERTTDSEDDREEVDTSTFTVLRAGVVATALVTDDLMTGEAEVLGTDLPKRPGTRGDEGGIGTVGCVVVREAHQK